MILKNKKNTGSQLVTVFVVFYANDFRYFTSAKEGVF